MSRLQSSSATFLYEHFKDFYKVHVGSEIEIESLFSTLETAESERTITSCSEAFSFNHLDRKSMTTGQTSSAEDCVIIESSRTAMSCVYIV